MTQECEPQGHRDLQPPSWTIPSSPWGPTSTSEATGVSRGYSIFESGG